MNIQNYIGASQKQFSQLSKTDKAQILERYISQEPLPAGIALAAFVIENVPVQSTRGAKRQVNRFYTWYALNYGIAEQWSLRIHAFNLYDIDQIKIYPMQQYEEDGDILVRKSEKDFADHWSVYACSKEEEYCIADCKDEMTAIHFEHLLRIIISRWQIKVLLYVDIAGKRYISSSHSLEFMMIDRRMADEQKGGPSLHRILLLPYASPGKFYQDLPAQTADDLLIKSLVRAAEF